MGPLADNFFNTKILAQYGPSILGGSGSPSRWRCSPSWWAWRPAWHWHVVRAMSWRPADVAIVVFVDVFRTLPQLVVIVFIYFGLPYADIQLTPFAATVVALGAVLAAFATEIFWAAIQAVQASGTPRARWGWASSASCSG